MTAKAKDQVTIIDMTDVQSVVVYYLLQLSTLAAPAKPTVASPNGWSQTEPTYSGDDTKTLYTCIKTVYGDGSFEWGTVNVSSTYAAAKSAYNKAQSALLKLEPDALTTTISTALSGSNTITTTKFVMDKNGLLIKNGGLSIQNNAGTTVLSADSAGNLTIKGNIQMMGSQSMRVDNATGTKVGEIAFKQITGQTWSPGALKIMGYDYTSIETGDTTTSKCFGRIMAAGCGLAMFGQDKSIGQKPFFGFGQNGSLLGVKIDASSSSYDEYMVYNGKRFPQIVAGSMVVTVSNSNSAPIFTNTQINLALGTNGSTNTNTAVFVSNGDGGSANAHCQDATYLNGTWWVTFDRVFSATVRVNYLIAQFA